MKIVKTTFDKIKDYRVEYLNSLPAFQKLFIEIMINNYRQLTSQRLGTMPLLLNT